MGFRYLNFVVMTVHVDEVKSETNKGRVLNVLLSYISNGWPDSVENYLNMYFSRVCK